MIPAQFDYKRANTLDEALNLLAQNEDAMARTINPPAPQSQADGSAQAPPSTATSSPNESSEDAPSAAGETTARSDEQGRAVTASDNGPES